MTGFRLTSRIILLCFRGVECWRLPIRILGALTCLVSLVARGIAQESPSDDRSLLQLFGEGNSDDALGVRRRSLQMPADERYAYLLEQVLPSGASRIRIAVDFVSTNPSPPARGEFGGVSLPLLHTGGDRRIASGGGLVSPAVDLV